MKLFYFLRSKEHVAFGSKGAKALEDLCASPQIQETQAHGRRFYRNQFLNARASFFSPTLRSDNTVLLSWDPSRNPLVKVEWGCVWSERTAAELRKSAFSLTTESFYNKYNVIYFCNLPKDRGTHCLRRKGPGKCKRPCVARQDQGAGAQLPAPDNAMSIPSQCPPSFPAAYGPHLSI